MKRDRKGRREGGTGEGEERAKLKCRTLQQSKDWPVRCAWVTLVLSETLYKRRRGLVSGNKTRVTQALANLHWQRFVEELLVQLLL